jgi:hypothetical protein
MPEYRTESDSLGEVRVPPGEQNAGSPERPRQHGTVVQRLISLCHVHRSGGQCEAAVDSSGQDAARPDRGKG